MVKLLKPLSFIPAIVLMYMIFTFSSQTGEVSSQLSFKISCKIVEAGNYILDANLDTWQIEDWANKIHFITRKLAHFSVYFALAVAVSFPLYVYGLRGIRLMLTAGIICVGFAASDEYHQAFVAGRGPSVKDVVIDSVGAFCGIILVRMVGWTGRKTIFRPWDKEAQLAKSERKARKAAKHQKKVNKKLRRTYEDKSQNYQSYRTSYPPNQQGETPYYNGPQGYPPNQEGYYQNPQDYYPNQEENYQEPQGFYPNQEGYYQEPQGFHPNQERYYQEPQPVNPEPEDDEFFYD